MIVAPVTKTLVLACTPERAFAVFTDELSTWWPIETHSLHGVGGTAHLDNEAIYEIAADGTRNDWGTVLVWEPPHRVVMTWNPGEDKSVLTELELTFEVDDNKTRFTLIHRGWERYGESGEAFRNNYDVGWDAVLANYEP